MPDRAVANGGDLTLLLLPPVPDLAKRADELLGLVRAVETPLVLAIRDMADVETEAGALRAEADGFLAMDRDGLSYLPADDSEPAVLTDTMTGELLGERHPGDIGNGGALLVLGNRSPNLETEEEGRDTSRGSPLHRRSPRHGTTEPRCRALVITGTHSAAGKTYLVTAFARYFADLGLRVAPFKGQNISNNARVVDGGEIGVAQYIQALAARRRPDVRMNPVLIKPQSGGSHVLMLGHYDDRLSALPWRLRKPPAWRLVSDALHGLMDEHDLVIIEGAGSPAEPGQYRNDLVNMRIAREAEAPVLLVSDAGRGGGVAHCYGTWHLLPEDDRALVKGFILNRFWANGNPRMLDASRRYLERVTSLPTLGVVPELPYTLPEEDSYSLSRTSAKRQKRMAVVAYPHMSNFDEFTPVSTSGTTDIVWARDPGDLAGAELVVLPGSKDVPASARWLRDTGLADVIRGYAASGGRILAICGGLQLAGMSFKDDADVEGTGQGLGLLTLDTVYEEEKIQRTGSFTFGRLTGPWQRLSGITVDGYEIRHGRTRTTSDREIIPGGLAFVRENVLAVYFHGVFENAKALEAVLGIRSEPHADLERTFDGLAESLSAHLDMRQVERIALG
ncbi:cobyric acid synthase [Actinomadura terrae]|uniref:cobyric acid synthase n=1 Tax=Actinomadura terrae TaxID=604353 RepID=UPI001FA74659|nr:cobyric acid synthase [Actinomadura terrae]